MGDRTKEAFVAFTNTDCTEGRGHDVPIAVCEIEATAVRLAKKAYVQGSDGPVRKTTLTYHDGDWGYWSGPVNLVAPSREDMVTQAAMDKWRDALNRAKAAGLSDDDIKALSTPPQGPAR